MFCDTAGERKWLRLQQCSSTRLADSAVDGGVLRKADRRSCLRSGRMMTFGSDRRRTMKGTPCPARWKDHEQFDLVTASNSGCKHLAAVPENGQSSPQELDRVRGMSALAVFKVQG